MTRTILLKGGDRLKMKCEKDEIHLLQTTKHKLQIFVYNEKIELHIPEGFSYNPKPDQEYILAAPTGKDVELIHTCSKVDTDKSKTQN
tara:strand:+ start:7251 stop:7514 length:264 start_codon:yes stop_codon:yes gene_type:complete